MASFADQVRGFNSHWALYNPWILLSPVLGLTKYKIRRNNPQHSVFVEFKFQSQKASKRHLKTDLKGRNESPAIWPLGKEDHPSTN